MIAICKVLWHALLNDRHDIHDRQYRDVYKKFGLRKMVWDYKHGNTWRL